MITEYIRAEGQMAIISQQLSKRFNMDKESVKPRLNQLESNDLLELSTLILDYDRPEPIYHWIDERVKSRTASHI